MALLVRPVQSLAYRRLDLRQYRRTAEWTVLQDIVHAVHPADLHAIDLVAMDVLQSGANVPINAPLRDRLRPVDKRRRQTRGLPFEGIVGCAFLAGSAGDWLTGRDDSNGCTLLRWLARDQRQPP